MTYMYPVFEVRGPDGTQLYRAMDSCDRARTQPDFNALVIGAEKACREALASLTIAVATLQPTSNWAA